MTANLYFAGKLIGRYTGTSASGTTTFEVESDRLGTIDAGNQYPWGEEKQTTEQNREKFATYYRDGTGLDYADQRYYSSIVGRFLTVDPYTGSAHLSAPQSWNRYAYANSDPVNIIDPTGLEGNGEYCTVNGLTWPVGCAELYPMFRRNLPQSPFQRAIGNLQTAQEALLNRTRFSVLCLQDLQSIAAQRSPEFRNEDIFSVFDAAIGANLENGVGSRVPISGLYVDATAGAAAQRVADAAYGPGQTIGNNFARNPVGLTAQSVLGGGTIYINPGLIGSNIQNNEALLIHEALHLLGFVDDDIQKGLALRGVKVDPTNTKSITDALKKDCVTGRGNN